VRIQLGRFDAKPYLYRLKNKSMKKTLLSFVLIITTLFVYSQTPLKYYQDFEAITLDQDTFSISNFFENNPGKKVALEFFYADNYLCKETSILINEMYERFGSNEGDLYFLSINVADDSATTAWYRDSLELNIPMVAGQLGGDYIDSLYQIESYPTFIMIQSEARYYEEDSVFSENDTTIIAAHFRNIILQDIWPLPDADSLYNFLEFHLYDPSGVNDLDHSKKSFSVYPNPTSDYLNILSSELEGEFEIDILDLSGKLLFSKQGRLQLNEAYQINQMHLNRGVYILKLRNQTESYSEKLIIQ